MGWGVDIPTVNNNMSTLSSPSPLAASSQPLLTSSLIKASPCTSLALPSLMYFSMVVSASKQEGDRSRNVTVAPFSTRLDMLLAKSAARESRRANVEDGGWRSTQYYGSLLLRGLWSRCK